MAKKEGRGCQGGKGRGNTFQVEQLCPGVLEGREGLGWSGWRHHPRDPMMTKMSSPPLLKAALFLGFSISESYTIGTRGWLSQ